MKVLQRPTQLKRQWWDGEKIKKLATAGNHYYQKSAYVEAWKILLKRPGLGLSATLSEPGESGKKAGPGPTEGISLRDYERKKNFDN